MAVAEFYKIGSPAVTNPPSYLTNGFLTFLWVVSGVATVAGPLIYRSMKIGNYQLQNMFQNCAKMVLSSASAPNRKFSNQDTIHQGF